MPKELKATHTFKNRISLILFFFLFVCNISFSQEDSTKNHIDKALKVPSMREAVDMALEKSPLLKSADISASIKEYEYRSAKKEWLDNIGVESFYKYGSIDNVNIQNVGSSEEMSTGKSVDTRYAVGVYLKMSIQSMLSQSKKNQIARREIEISRYEKEQIEQQITALVITQYSDYQLNKELLSVSNSAYQSTLIQLEKANSDYHNGNMSVYDITKITESKTKAQSDYLKSKFRFKVSYLLLMELIGAMDNDDVLNEEW